jgi:murein DD-endopeptidase MepM/ murein hydrolase activator NlpD
MGNGLWGTGFIKNDGFDFTSTEIETDDTGCQSTRIHTGRLSGSDTELEGTFTTTVTFDADSCEAENSCTIETSTHLSLIEPYLSSCIDRDEFGDPAESEYILPWPTGKSYVLNNSYCLPTGHREQQAYDFLIPISDPIIASRAGVVRAVKEDSPDDGQGSTHNHVMIEHADGTVGFYAHLKQMGVLVSVGENVEAGQNIALAGHSGTTDVVHLHFGVYGSWPPVEGDDRAINFNNMEGPVDCRGGLVNGATYTAR